MAKTSKAVINQPNRKKYMNRLRNRCNKCGRAHGYIRFVGLCRLCFRELANRGELPGVTKASW